MEHTKFKELLQLHMLEELNDDEKFLLENHILECNECNEELENLKQLYSAVVENRPRVPDDQSLQMAREDLFSSLRNEPSKTSVIDKIIEWVESLLFTNYKLALGSVVTLIAGIFIGYLFFSPAELHKESIQFQNTIDLDEIEKSGLGISNIRFTDPFSGNGDIEINFDALKPISYKGKPDDVTVQRLLAMALVTSDNPGTRLRTLNTIANNTQSNFIPDQKVQKALISALKVDENPGVRREALNVLKKYPFNNEIRDAFLHVLANDSNSGLRVAAINALADLNTDDVFIDNEIKNELNNRVNTDDNDFIRIRAASLLKEVN